MIIGMKELFNRNENFIQILNDFERDILSLDNSNKLEKIKSFLTETNQTFDFMKYLPYFTQGLDIPCEKLKVNISDLRMKLVKCYISNDIKNLELICDFENICLLHFCLMYFCSESHFDPESRQIFYTLKDQIKSFRDLIVFNNNDDYTSVIKYIILVLTKNKTVYDIENEDHKFVLRIDSEMVSFEKVKMENYDLLKNTPIVVIDDDRVNLKIIRRELEMQKFSNIETFEKPIEALKFFVKNPQFRLIFTDVNMPLLTGFELSKKIRENEVENPKTKKSIIIGCSSDVNNDKTAAYKSSGMNSFIPKPIKSENLRLILNNLIIT